MITGTEIKEKIAAGTDLFALFAQETEPKSATPPPVEPPKTGTHTAKETPKTEPAAEKPETDVNTDKQGNTETPQAKKGLFEFENTAETPETPVNKATEKKPLTDAQRRTEAEKSADFYVSTIDGAQHFVFKKIITARYKKKIGGAKSFADALDLCEDILEEVKTIDDITLEEKINLRIAKRFISKIDELPFTELETQRLNAAVMRLQESQPDFQLPPWAQFATAVTIALAPRIADAFD